MNCMCVLRQLIKCQLSIVLLLLGSCNNPGEKAPDVSGVKVQMSTFRFDKDLYAIDTNHIGDGLQKLSGKYPDFLNFFLDTIMAFGIHGNYRDSARAITEGLKVFLTYKDYVNLEDTIKKHYPDTKDVENNLERGFQLMKYYYPAYKVPKVIFISLGLRNLPAFTVDSLILGICLDMFLGEEYPYYRSIGIPAYMAFHLRKSYIPVAAFKVIYTNTHPFVMEERTLLDMMIQRGKEQYFLHKILPSAPDSVLFGITADQLEWCAANEAMIYNFFIHRNLLFNKESQNVSYVTDGPFSAGIPPSGKIKTTPGNIGSWLGYRIVGHYMAQHPNLNLKELCDQQIDPAKFLDEAKYKPK